MDSLLGQPEQLGVGGELGVGLEDLGLGRTGHLLDRLAQLAELGLGPSQRRTQAGGLHLPGPRPLPRQLILQRRPRCHDERRGEGGPGRRGSPGQPGAHDSSASPMPVSTSSTRPASASSAPSPVVRMRISSPWWQSSVRTDSTDFALTSFPPFTSTTSAAKDAAARAKILAGRAWRPVGFRNTTVASGTCHSLGGPGDRSGIAASPPPPAARNPASRASPAPTVLRGTTTPSSPCTGPASSTRIAPSGPSETRTARTPWERSFSAAATTSPSVCR